MEARSVLKLDAVNPGLMQTVHAVRYDSGRMVRCYIANLEKKIGSARVYTRKPSGKECFTDSVVVSNSCVVFGMTEQMLAEVGRTSCQLQLIGTEQDITLFEFEILVKDNLLAGGEMQSSSEYQAFVNALKKLEEFNFTEITKLEIDELDEAYGGEEFPPEPEEDEITVEEINQLFS